MKKIFLVITLLVSFFLSPVKADSYENDPYFFGYTYLDLTQLGMGNEVIMGITWYFHTLAPVKMIYKNVPRLINMTQTRATGTATINSGNGTVLTATFTWDPFDDYATLNYMGMEFVANNWFPTPAGNQGEFNVGNNYEWWSDSQEENPSSNIDLSTIQNYLLIISFLLFINFLRG